MADRSADWTLNVPPAEPTVIDLAPLGRRESVPEPALTVPEKETSLAVMVIAELVLEIEVEPALVTLPVPSVVIVTPVVPVALALRAIEPLEPDEVCNTSELPEKAFEAVMVPLAVRVKVPLVDVMLPEVPIVAEALVVVIEKLPPTVDVPSVTAPVLLTSAVAEPPALAVRIPAWIRIGVPDVPMLPVEEVRLTVLAVSVTLPDRVMVPEPLALTLTIPDEPALTLALIVMAALAALVVSEMVPPLDIVNAVGILRALPDVIEILPDVSTMVP